MRLEVEVLLTGDKTANTTRFSYPVEVDFYGNKAVLRKDEIMHIDVDKEEARTYAVFVYTTPYWRTPLTSEDAWLDKGCRAEISLPNILVEIDGLSLQNIDRFIEYLRAYKDF